MRNPICNLLLQQRSARPHFADISNVLSFNDRNVGVWRNPEHRKESTSNANWIATRSDRRQKLSDLSFSDILDRNDCDAVGNESDIGNEAERSEKMLNGGEEVRTHIAHSLGLHLLFEIFNPCDSGSHILIDLK